MKIDMVNITPDYCVSESGFYLVKTFHEHAMGGAFSGKIRKYSILSAKVDVRFDEKKKRNVMSIDVNNQVPIMISKEPVL